MNVRLSSVVLSVMMTSLSISPVFAGSGLLELYALALEKDAQLQQAQAQHQADQQLIQQAKSLLLPNVSAQASYQQNDYSTKSVPFGTNSVNQQKLLISQPLYDASAEIAYQKAKEQLQLSSLTLKQQEQSLILRLAQSYFDVLRAEQVLRLTEVQVSAIALQKDKISEGVKVGLTNPVDQLEVQARYDLAEAERIQAETQVIHNREVLAQLIGRTPSILKKLPLTVQLMSHQPAGTKELSAQEMVNQYEQQNISVQMSQIKLALAEQDIALQKAGHQPTVSAQASVVNIDNDYLSKSAFPGQYQTNSLSLQVSMPIYAGGLITSRTQQAEHLKQVQQAGVQYAQEQARLDLLSLTKTLKASQSRLQALRQAVKSGEAFLLAAEEGHRVGMRELVDVLNARTNLSKAQQDLANALYDDVLNRFRLDYTQGQLSIEKLRYIEAYLVEAN